MYNVYRVTAAAIKKTRNGYELYNLQLNNTFWATKLVPLRAGDKRRDILYQQYTKNNNNLNFLIGSYVAISLEDSKFGKNFRHIESLDVLQDFKKLLDESNGKAFSTNINIFEFLESKGYPVNSDKTITLRNEYSHLNLIVKNGRTICYTNKTGEGTLTLENIETIYNHFFKGKYIDNGNPDRDEQYGLTSVAIIVNRKIFHKSKSEVISDDDFEILRIGDKLSKEQCHFLSTTHSSGNQ